ncbi:MAG TPA: Uma2 family endonuclease [Cyclobacteriaceae bacterium]|nr:Uma2 family endonuclease [Cyclobacteriaceae bacterium]
MDTLILKGKVTSGLTDEEFFWFCQENRGLRIERNSNLEIHIMSPVTSQGANYSGEVFRQLANWTVLIQTGLAFDSSAGFTLPDRSVLSPDASWVSREKWNSLSEDDKNRFSPICPEFIIEVRSKSDSTEELKKKMAVWLGNGAELAWLIDPIDKRTFVFRPDHPERVIHGFDKEIEGEGKITGFVLDLSAIST